MKSAFLLSIANGLSAVLGLFRNIIIARLLSVEDFGIASTFAIIMTLVEMTSNLGVNRLIVQARDGEAPVLQATLQTIQFTRGLLGAIILYLLASPIASVLGAQEAIWAFKVMAVVPLFRGLQHLDVFRFQREMRFVPWITVDVSAQAISTVTAILLGWITRDFSAMLWALVVQQAAFAACSHFVAKRPYRLGWDWQIGKRALEFGWPVLLSGVMLFGAFQGDRVIVANQMGMETLGWFSAAFSITLLPTLLLSRVLNTLALPRLSQNIDDPGAFGRYANLTIDAACAGGVLVAITFALIGGPVMLLLFGAKYKPALAILVWLSVMQALRSARTGPSTIAVSTGETTNPMIANIARILFLPIAFLMAKYGADILHLIWIGCVGEMCSLFVSFYLLKSRHPSITQSGFLKVSAALGVFATILANELIHPISDNLFSLQSSLLMCCAACLYLYFNRNLAQWVWQGIQQFKAHRNPN